LIALFACLAVAFAAPAEEKKETLQTANSFGLGYGLYGGYGEIHKNLSEFPSKSNTLNRKL